MAQYDTGSRVDRLASIRAASHSGATDGVSKDLSGSYGATVEWNIGAVVGTNTVVIQDSPDDSVFTTVTGTALFTDVPATITTSNHNTSYKSVYLGVKRYLRARVDTVGTTILCSGTIITKPRHVNV